VIVALPLLGWVLTDIPGFLASPVRRLFLFAAIVLNAVTAIRIPGIGKKRGHEKKVVGRQHIAIVLLQILSMALLLTGGPYRFIRHPRYAGIILFTTGIVLVSRSWVGCVLTALLVAVLNWRIHDEEVLMHEELGMGDILLQNCETPGIWLQDRSSWSPEPSRCRWNHCIK